MASAGGKRTAHPNAGLHHLYNVCESADGRWYVATVHAGMGESHAILAIEAKGKKVFNLQIPGCRPDISPDGNAMVVNGLVHVKGHKQEIRRGVYKLLDQPGTRYAVHLHVFPRDPFHPAPPAVC